MCIWRGITRNSPVGGHGNPLQYSCLENPMDRRTWGATVHGVAKSQMRLSDFHFTQLSSVVPQPCPTLQLHGLQHARLPCPSPIPRAYSDLCPLSWWCHPTILSSVVPFSPHLQSFPASGLVSSSHQVAKVLELQLQHQSFQWILSTDFL